MDSSGERESRLVARSVQGDVAPAFAADGTLLFLSGRENTDSAAEKSESRGVGLWALPDRGEARQIAHHPGGISSFAVARSARAHTVAYTADLATTPRSRPAGPSPLELSRVPAATW